LNRPAKALELLADADTHKLPPSQAALVQKITAKALDLQSEGVFELDTEAW
jgi:hypothetical protein